MCLIRLLFGKPLVQPIAVPLVLASACVALHAAPGTVVEWGLKTGVPFSLSNNNFVEIAAGENHLLALDASGNLLGWGGNSQGELSINSSFSGGQLIRIAAGSGKSAGLWSTGRVTWSGFDFSSWSDVATVDMQASQTVASLSDGTVQVKNGNFPPAGLTDVTAVAAGGNHALALITGGTVVAWGDNFYGQSDVPEGLSGVIAIAAGDTHSMALKSDGTVVAWGAGTTVAAWPHYGQSIIPAGLTGVTAISAGSLHSVALKSDGTVVCWGNNDFGQCEVPATVRNVQKISAGGAFTAAIMLPEPDITVIVDGRSFRSGFRHEFFAEAGGTVSRSIMIVNFGTAPLTGLAVTKDGPDAAKFSVGTLPVTTLAPGESATFSVTFQPDTARAYLADLHITSNDPDETPFSHVLSGRTPMGASIVRAGNPRLLLDRIPVAAGDFTDIDSNGPYSVVVRADGSLTSWGGDDENTPGVSPMIPPPLWPGVREASIGGEETSLLITRDGALWTWTPRGVSPGQELLPSSAAVRQIASGPFHYLAIKGDGTIHAGASGDNAFGQATIPPGLWPVEDIAAGGYFSLALLGDGSVHAWGRNNDGETNLPEGLVAVDVAAGDYHAIALRPDGTVIGWGRNAQGQLNIPAGLDDVIAVEARGSESAAIRRDGSVIVWGNGSSTVSDPQMPRAAVVTAGWQCMALTAPLPEISLSQSGDDIADGFGVDFDWSPVGVPVVKTFTISNKGGATATLTLNKTGAQAGDYVVSGFPASLAPGASANFTITFTPAINGVRLATLQIGSADYDENPFDVPLSGRTPLHVSAWGLRSAATNVPQGLNDAVAVAAGSFHSLALRSNGTVVAWGDNDFGECDVPAGLTNVKAISAGAGYSLALRNDGSVAHWGNLSGFLPPGLTGVKAISAGFSHALALKSDGTIAGWGSDLVGEISGAVSQTGIRALAAGQGFSVGCGDLDVTRGHWFGSGKNDYGQAETPEKDGIALAAGFQHAAMLLPDGTVVGWGRNQFGQATPPPGLKGVRVIEAGQDFTLALKNNGSLAAWGVQSLGSPAAATGFGPVGGIAVGDNHILALTTAFPSIAVFNPIFGEPFNSGSATVNLGSAGLAGSEPRSITISNQGAATLTGLSVSLNGSDATHFSVTQPTVASLAPGASTTFSVRFVPTATGSRQVTLQIASNDPDEAPFVINLYGQTDFTPIQAWRYSWFGASGNIDPTGNVFDFDADGISNLMECAFGTNPVANGSGRLPLRYSGPAAGGGTLIERGTPTLLIEKNGSTTTVRGLWIRRKDHLSAGIVYTPEFSADLTTFTASSITPQVLATDGYYDVVAVTFPVSVPGGIPHFFRVRVNVPNPDPP